MKKYGTYSKDVQDSMKAINRYLKSQFGDIKDEWEVSLTLLADNLELYNKCKESVSKNGIYDSSTGRKNPLLATMKDIQATLTKQIQHFGLSPYALSKIKQEAEDDSEDYIEGLVNGEV